MKADIFLYCIYLYILSERTTRIKSNQNKRSFSVKWTDEYTEIYCKMQYKIKFIFKKKRFPDL